MTPKSLVPQRAVQVGGVGQDSHLADWARLLERTSESALLVQHVFGFADVAAGPLDGGRAVGCVVKDQTRVQRARASAARQAWASKVVNTSADAMTERSDRLTFERGDAHGRLDALSVPDQAAASAAAEMRHDEVDCIFRLAERFCHLVADVGVAQPVEAVLDEGNGRLVFGLRDGVRAPELRNRLVEQGIEAEHRVGVGEVFEALFDDEHGVVVVQRRERRDGFHLVERLLLLLVAVADHDRVIGGSTVDDAVRDKADPSLALVAEDFLLGHVAENLFEDVFVAHLALELLLLVIGLAAFSHKAVLVLGRRVSCDIAGAALDDDLVGSRFVERELDGRAAAIDGEVEVGGHLRLVASRVKPGGQGYKAEVQVRSGGEGRRSLDVSHSPQRTLLLRQMS